MNRGSLLAIGGVVLGALLALGAVLPDQVQVGRFDVVVGVWIDHKTGKEESVAVLVDTATGDTYWRSSGDIPWSLVPAPRPR